MPVGLGLLFLAFDKTSSLSASIITSLKPIAFVLAGFLFLGDRVTKKERKGLLVTFVGFLIIVTSPLLSQEGNGEAHLPFVGNLYVLANIFVDTVASVIAKNIMRSRVSSLALSQIGFIIGYITLTPVALYYSSPQQILADMLKAPTSAHAGVLYMAVLAGSLAHALRYRAIRSLELSETAVFGYLLPVFAAPISILWLHETYTPLFAVGAITIFVGIVIAETKKSTKKNFYKLHAHRQGM